MKPSGHIKLGINARKTRMFKHTLWRTFAPLAIVCSIAYISRAQNPERSGQAPEPKLPPAINFDMKSPSERMEMTVHTSRIVTIGQKISQAQVNNPEILDVTPLSPTQVQVSAKTSGVTQLNIWGEDQKIFTIDVIVYGDAQELRMMLRSQFPNAALTVIPVGNSVLISGYVDKPEHIDRIIRITEEYYPKVINNMTVGGVQTVLLHVKVMEVSRTKLRKLGFDFAMLSGSNFLASGISGLLNATTGTSIGTNSTLAFDIVDGSTEFFGVLEALRQDNLLKVLAEPTLVTESGRAASFNF